MAKKTVAAKKRVVKVDAMGQLHVHSSFNNIIVSLANSEGQVISWSSAGKMGFRGSKKNGSSGLCEGSLRPWLAQGKSFC